MDRPGGIGQMDRMGGEGFGEGFVESTGFGVEQGAGLGVTYNWKGQMVGGGIFFKDRRTCRRRRSREWKEANRGA